MISPAQSSESILTLIGKVKIIPVLVVDNVNHAKALAKILIDCELPIMEVTLRTKAALAVIEAMAYIDGATVVAGTVLTEQNMISIRMINIILIAEFLVVSLI